MHNEHYQSWSELNIIEEVWDHLDHEQNKVQEYPKKALNVLHEAWRTIPEAYLKT